MIAIKPPAKAKPPAPVKKTMPAKMADNRVGRLSTVNTDRGAFRFKANRKGE